MKTIKIASPLNHEPVTVLEVYPDQYLHVRDNKSGDEWVCPMTANTNLDLPKLVSKWVKAEFGGELFRSSMSRVGGDYTATIYTDGREPGGVCWTSGDFWLQEQPEGRFVAE